MDLQDTAAYAQILDTRDRLASESGPGWFQRAGELGRLSDASRNPKPRSSTFGDVLRVAIGGALGYGLGRGASSVLGLSDSSANSVSFTGAMMGGLMGLTKSASDRRAAFRVAFIKAAIDQGYFKGASIGSMLFSPVTDLSGVAQRVGTSTGTVIGGADAPDDTDTDIVRAKVEAELLRQELKRVKAVRTNELLKQVLAKYRG
jgi:hypothetical protein